MQSIVYIDFFKKNLFERFSPNIPCELLGIFVAFKSVSLVVMLRNPDRDMLDKV